MSADNWGICPRCLKKAEADLDEAILQKEQLYGKVPLAEFDKIRARAETEVDPEKYRTLREDYEVYMDEEGFFHIITYRGECIGTGKRNEPNNCGFSHTFEHEEVVHV